ncbi:MAG TPA: hypothetical protein VN894_08930 [Polyangiaceae bacterium]|nr:hypothetical protein [Polyangiaceae bacterium]
MRWGRGLRAAVFFSCALPALSCGYHAVYGGQGPERLHVQLVRTLVPDAVASDEVASGVREELLREGALEPGDGWPRAEVEVLRASESSEGIAARAGRPAARAIDVGLTGRAWIVRAPGASPERDTGDMRAAEVISVDETAGVADPRSSWFHQEDALRAAARRLGRKLARKVMGHPAAPDMSEEVDR